MKKQSRKYTVEQMVSAIRKARGMRTVAAEALGCAYRTVCRYEHEYAAVRQAVHEETEHILDVGELALFDAVDEGEAWAISFLLKCKGKCRGYTERQQVDVRVDQIDAEIRRELDRMAGGAQAGYAGPRAADANAATDILGQ